MTSRQAVSKHDAAGMLTGPFATLVDRARDAIDGKA
jgi:hypothetical protein